jgi:hypothetical protein
MGSPAVDLTTWLKSLPQDIQEDIAALMSSAHPGLKFELAVIIDRDKLLNSFYEVIEAQQKRNFASAGFLIAFRAIFDFLFAQRGTPNGWDLPEASFRDMLASDDPDHEILKANAQRMLDELPARRESWKQVCKQWTELKETSLSDTDLELWALRRM